MTYLSGRDGKVTYAGVTLGKVSGWTLSSSVEALEVTTLGDIARNYTPGLLSATGSCSIWYYADAPVSVLSKVVRTGAATEADILTLTLGFGEKSITFKCLFTAAELAMSVGEVLRANVQFQVCGANTGVSL